MKIILLLLSILFVSCTSKTQYGDCIGAFDDELKNPKLVYKINAVNAAVGIIFFQTIIVPMIVILNETQCPIAEKPAPL